MARTGSAKESQAPVVGAVGACELERATPSGRAARVAELKALETYYREHGDPETAADYGQQARALEAEIRAAG